ncbi:hypothetical protein M1523_00990 [Patescibacteria group bacterium]|nr:hypothetical protein [Patescibacteria group bacterium]MCL5091733.1 hypothetical protein [Patescibacteria group bacterium]
MLIIGLVGRLRGGKNESARILERHGFAQVIISEILRDELEQYGLPHTTRDDFIEGGIILKETYGTAYLMHRALQQAKTTGAKTVVIDGLRHLDEIDFLLSHQHLTCDPVSLLGVDADVNIRRERARQGDSRDTGTERFTPDFDQLDAEENHHPNPAGPQLDQCFAILRDGAGTVIENNGPLPALETQITQYVQRLMSDAEGRKTRTAEGRY